MAKEYEGDRQRLERLVLKIEAEISKADNADRLMSLQAKAKYYRSVIRDLKASINFLAQRYEKYFNTERTQI